jgi:hypothetical protein
MVFQDQREYFVCQQNEETDSNASGGCAEVGDFKYTVHSRPPSGNMYIFLTQTKDKFCFF